jgi:hypothetical protein
MSVTHGGSTDDFLFLKFFVALIKKEHPLQSNKKIRKLNKKYNKRLPVFN